MVRYLPCSVGSLDFDPDKTGTPVPTTTKSTTERVCPFGHRRKRCRCPLRPDYWTNPKRETRDA